MLRMLIQLNEVEDDVLAKIREKFEALDANGDGVLDAKDIKLIKVSCGGLNARLLDARV